MALKQDLIDIVKTAGSRRDTYHTSDYLQLAIMAVSEKEGIDAGSQLLDTIDTFLLGRGTHAREDYEKLASNGKSSDILKVMVNGSAFYFGRRGFLMAHDAEGTEKEKLIDPIPLIQNVFGSMGSLSDQQAAIFLEMFGNFLTRKPDTRNIGVGIMRDILLQFNSDYKMELTAIAGQHNVGGPTYVKKKKETDQSYADSLLKIFGYARMVMVNSGVITREGFYKYVGKEIPKPVETKVQLTHEYLNELLKKKLPYRNIMTQIEKEVGSLVAVDFKGNRDTNNAGIDVLYGSTSNPSRTHYKVSKDKDRTFFRLMLAICGYAKQKADIPRQYTDMTKRAEQHIISVLV